MKIKINTVEGLGIPTYATSGSSGLDLRANIHETIILKPMERVLIPSGVRMEIPEGYEGQVRGRSGLALNYGIGIVNGLGTIDSDYRGFIGVMLINFSSTPFTINRGDKIAQLVICPVQRVELVEVDKLGESTRGINGYGHTGI